ncbi:DUF3418 domain-containing protein, partial [Hoyosella sp. G463]
AVSVEAVEDVREQLASLTHPGFVTECGMGRLAHMARYLVAARKRIGALPGSATREARGMAVLDRVYGELDRVLARLPDGARASDAVVAVHWMIEELRVSLFAQAVGTAGPVSEQRVLSAITELARRPA